MAGGRDHRQTAGIRSTAMKLSEKNGSMPGISFRGDDLVVVVIPREHCAVESAYPRMIQPEVT